MGPHLFSKVESVSTSVLKVESWFTYVLKVESWSTYVLMLESGSGVQGKNIICFCQKPLIYESLWLIFCFLSDDLAGVTRLFSRPVESGLGQDPHPTFSWCFLYHAGKSTIGLNDGVQQQMISCGGGSTEKLASRI